MFSEIYGSAMSDHDECENILSVTEKLPILPIEIWHHIFKFLTRNELKSATMISRAWNSLISNSPQFIMRTRFHFRGKESDIQSKDLNCRHSYRCVRVSEHRISCAPELFSRWTFLTQLEFDKCTIDGSQLLKFLRNCPTIKMLAMHEVEIENRDECNDPVELKLTDLALQHMDESTDWIFNHFHCIEVSNYLEIRGQMEKRKHTFSLVNFLNRVEGEINFLIIVEVNLNCTKKLHITPSFKFKWRFLYIEPLGLKAMLVTPNSLKMKSLCEACTENSTLRLMSPKLNLAARKSALQILKFCVDSPIETLELFGGFEDVQFDSFGIFKSVTCLHLDSHGDRRSSNIMSRKFLSMFPNVTKLQMHLRFKDSDRYGYITDDFALLASSFKNVKTLSVDFRYCSYYCKENRLINYVLDSIDFPQLESLMLQPLRDFERGIKKYYWLEELIYKHRNIKTISFNDHGERNIERFKYSYIDCEHIGLFYGNIITHNYDRPKCEQFLKTISQYIKASVQKLCVNRATNTKCTKMQVENVPYRKTFKLMATQSMSQK